MAKWKTGKCEYFYCDVFLVRNHLRTIYPPHSDVTTWGLTGGKQYFFLFLIYLLFFLLIHHHHSGGVHLRVCIWPICKRAANVLHFVGYSRAHERSIRRSP